MIIPGHGVIWRSHVAEILDAYEKWSTKAPETGALVVFDSMWNSTESIARAIAEGFSCKGVPVKLVDLKTEHISNIIPFVLDCKYIAVGSPTLNNNMMPNVAAFRCYLKGLSPKNREAFAFGSYGWGGQSVGQVEEELVKCGFNICMDKIRIQYVPSREQLEEVEAKVEALIGA